MCAPDQYTITYIHITCVRMDVYECICAFKFIISNLIRHDLLAFSTTNIGDSKSKEHLVVDCVVSS